MSTPMKKLVATRKTILVFPEDESFCQTEQEVEAGYEVTVHDILFENKEEIYVQWANEDDECSFPKSDWKVTE